MSEQEGVIKYNLSFEIAGAVSDDLRQLNVWRSILHGLGLIGQLPDRYMGYSYGNISQRRRGQTEQFIISASQTGQVSQLSRNEYACIEKCDISRNQVFARGPAKPSSEALTHAILYQLNPAIQCVMHVHDPILWRYGLNHGKPATRSDVEYGTPAMALEIERLYQDSDLAKQKILVMAGHEDGVISFGESIDEAGYFMLGLWIEAH